MTDPLTLKRRFLERNWLCFQNLQFFYTSNFGNFDRLLPFLNILPAQEKCFNYTGGVQKNLPLQELTFFTTKIAKISDQSDKRIFQSSLSLFGYNVAFASLALSLRRFCGTTILKRDNISSVVRVRYIVSLGSSLDAVTFHVTIGMLKAKFK